MAASSTPPSISPNPENLNPRHEPSPPQSPDSNEPIIIVQDETPPQDHVEGEEEDEEEEAECGFCIYMKAGGCKDPFIAWEKCVEEAEKNSEDVVNRCAEVTTLLKKCMDEHPDYYEPILRVERELLDSVSEVNTGSQEKETDSKIHSSSSSSSALDSDNLNSDST